MHVLWVQHDTPFPLIPPFPPTLLLGNPICSRERQGKCLSSPLEINKHLLLPFYDSTRKMQLSYSDVQMVIIIWQRSILFDSFVFFCFFWRLLLNCVIPFTPLQDEGAQSEGVYSLSGGNPHLSPICGAYFMLSVSCVSWKNQAKLRLPGFNQRSLGRAKPPPFLVNNI